MAAMACIDTLLFSTILKMLSTEHGTHSMRNLTAECQAVGVTPTADQMKALNLPHTLGECDILCSMASTASHPCKLGRYIEQSCAKTCILGVQVGSQVFSQECKASSGPDDVC